ncbi:DNA excision repair protein ERCC-6-like 2 [Diretmus argenteus]
MAMKMKKKKAMKMWLLNLTIAPSPVYSSTWHEGDSCLAPSPRDGTLQEARIQRLICTSHNNDTTALVVFTDQNKDCGEMREEEEEDKEEAIPVSKLRRPDLNHFTQEKPLFPSSLTHAGDCEPLKLSQSGAGGENVPYTINRYLRDYQREGIKFIYDNYISSRGCILGDDMGLGKTVQVIGFLAALLQKTGTWKDIENNRPQFLQTQMSSKPNKVFLIVAPLSVLYNWKDELDTWGHFQCVVVHGLRKEEELARISKGRSEIALTTYETLRLCLDQFNSIDWSAVVVDEAHKIKNPKSQITQAMKELRCQVRIGLTGTILQNNLEELWCVMDWAIPGCLGSLGHFKNKFSDPIEHGQRHSATKRTLAMGRKAVRALARNISHWFLRRTKALIKEQLPKKDDRVVYCSLTDFQQTVYQTVLDTEDVTLLLRSSDKCDCQSGRTRRSCCYGRNAEGVQLRELYFSYLAILRKVANHVALLQSTAGTSKNQKKYVSAICEKVFQKFPDFVLRCKNEAFEAMSDPMYSGKMKVLQKLVTYYMQRRDKVLIFSLSTKLLDVLEAYCMAEGLDYSRLDGTTKSKERLKIVKDFNSCPHTNLCLVSTMAGGLGLNFVGANVVVLFDPTWNPANDLQAIDRAYRIGQCRDVTVLRLISLGTVEEVIYLRQVYKQQLQCSVVGKESARRYFEAVQGPDGHKGELFGIKNLFRLQTQGTCLTRQILEREGRVESGVMTTSTHTGEEKEEERKRVSESGDTPPTNATELNDEMAKENRGASEIPRGVLDFSSGSEDDHEDHGARRKASGLSAADGTGRGNASTSPGQMTLLQHGFSRLLQRVGVKPGLGDGDRQSEESLEGSNLDENREDPGKKEDTSAVVSKSTSTLRNGAVDVPKSRKGKNWDTSSGSEREDGVNGDGGQQRGDSRLRESDNTGGERPVLKGWMKRKRIMDAESGVQEVAYTHSNQHVVGGSKAEERISKAALRDVFERKMYSQLPANHLLGTQESLSESPPLTPPRPATVRVERPSVDHPVTFTTKTVHHTKCTTFIIGETPQAIRRQQLEEMAATFKLSSARQFAEEVLRSSSAQRLAWLRQHYTSLNHPDLANTVTNNFPQPDSAPPVATSSSYCTLAKRRPRKAAAESHSEAGTSQKNVPKPQKKLRTPRRKILEPLSDVPSPESEERDQTVCNARGHKRTKRSSGSSTGAFRAGGGLGSDQATSSGLGPAEAAASLDHRDRDAPSSPDLSHDWSTTPSVPTAQRNLIGDTSILDDLFRPKPRGGQQRGALKMSPTSTVTPPFQKSKGRSKDFWDILNEGNEESINRLTDLSEVARVCVNTDVTAMTKAREEEKKTVGLWKTNEKFLWKKV